MDRKKQAGYRHLAGSTGIYSGTTPAVLPEGRETVLV